MNDMPDAEQPGQFLENAMQVLTMVLCVSIFIAVCAKSHTVDSVTTKRTDLEALQGTWSVQQVLPSFTFNGTNMEYHGGITQVWYKATFILREDTTPKRLEAVVTDCPCRKHVGQTIHAIYKIEDGKLTFNAYGAGDPSWPSNFDPGALVFLHAH